MAMAISPIALLTSVEGLSVALDRGKPTTRRNFNNLINRNSAIAAASPYEYDVCTQEEEFIPKSILKPIDDYRKKARKKKVAFAQVTTFEFERCGGYCTVPKSPQGPSLGMEMHHINEFTTSIKKASKFPTKKMSPIHHTERTRRLLHNGVHPDHLKEIVRSQMMINFGRQESKLDVLEDDDTFEIKQQRALDRVINKFTFMTAPNWRQRLKMRFRDFIQNFS